MNYALTVEAPTPKAAISVSEVTVMDTPACFNAIPMRSGIEILLGLERQSGNRLFQHCMITNMSSTPIPKSRKGKILLTGPYTRKQAEPIPYEIATERPTQLIPAMERYGC